jgi:hypothetical protein
MKKLSDWNAVSNYLGTAKSEYQSLWLFTFALLVYLFALYFRIGDVIADDGAFFLRYAENMLSGEFWVWNAGESPVWGASAPLYPLLIALPLYFGVTPEHALIVTGMILVAFSFSWLVVILSSRFGLSVGVLFLLFTSFDSELMYASASGLETPLTLFLLVLAVCSVVEFKRLWLVGLIAGVLMVQKLDLVPVAGFLLLSLWVREKHFPFSAVIIAAVIALGWYGFAWCYFGAPVPNSFLTKALYQNDQVKSIDWTWFSSVVFYSGFHKILFVLLIPAVFLNFKRNLPLLTLLLGTLLVHSAAYTIKYPFEPYVWYCMPALFSLICLASIGAWNLQEKLKMYLSSNSIFPEVAVVCVIAVLVVAFYERELVIRSANKLFTSHHEFDRSEAGRWVDKHAPNDFKVFTSWGNPAFYSNREVIDGSFLNRKFEPVDLISKYKPELLILQATPGVTPMAPVFSDPVIGGDYTVVKVFDKTYRAGMDYFFTVLARNDVVHQLSDVSVSRDFYSLLSKIEIGKVSGLVKVNSKDELFLHSGQDDPTKINFDVAKLKASSPRDDFAMFFSISENISSEAVARGAGNVKVSIFNGAKQLFSAVVDSTHPFSAKVDLRSLSELQIVVDPNGSNDTDWLVVRFD